MLSEAEDVSDNEYMLHVVWEEVELIADQPG